MRHIPTKWEKNKKISEERLKWYRAELARVRALPEEELQKEFLLRVSRDYMLRAMKDCLKEESVLHGFG